MSERRKATTGANNPSQTGLSRGGETLLASYLHYLEKRGYADKTVARYTLSVKNFGRFIAPTTYEKATHADVEEWLDRPDTLCLRTQSQYLTDLRVFYKWGIRQGYVKVNPTDRVDPPRLPPLRARPAKPEAIDRAWRLADSEMKLILMLMAYAGLRCCEVAALYREDVMENADPPRIEVLKGKGKKQRSVALAEEIVPWLAYAPDRGPLFPNRSGVAIQADTMSRKVRLWFKQVGLPETKAHMLRHYFGTTLSGKSGGNIVVVQDAMGHADPATTRKYIQGSGLGAAPYINSLSFHQDGTPAAMAASGETPPAPPRPNLRLVRDDD